MLSHASVMPLKMTSHSWHIFSVCDEMCMVLQHIPDVLYTIEVCMTKLDRVLARKFFQRPSDEKSSDTVGKEMTELTDIGEIHPGTLICDFRFDPCGYSMNGIDGNQYSTIHVTLEDGYSYASFECDGSIYDDHNNVIQVLKKVVQVFRPATISVSTTCINREVWTHVSNALELLGLKYRSCAVDEFPATGSVVFQTFSTRRK